MTLHDIKIDATLEAYLECMMWTNEELDGYCFTDLSKELIIRAQKDVTDFETEIYDKGLDTGLDSSQIGHDFLLTRNGHGAGFWDRDLGEQGDKLSDICSTYSEVSTYIGDDKLIYTF